MFQNELGNFEIFLLLFHFKTHVDSTIGSGFGLRALSNDPLSCDRSSSFAQINLHDVALPSHGLLSVYHFFELKAFLPTVAKPKCTSFI